MIYRSSITLESCPYIAYLFHEKEGYPCHGTVLTKKHILTNAVRGFKPVEGYSVRVGSSQPESGGSTYSVKRVHVHPGFLKEVDEPTEKKYYSSNDLAILELRGEIQDKRVKPIKIVDKSYESPERGQLVAWSRQNTSATAEKEYTLQRFQGRMWSLEECQRIYPTDDLDADAHCALVGKPDANPCLTQIFGGPVLDDETRQFGIFIGFPGNDRSKCQLYAHVYHALAPHRDWIDGVLQSTSDEEDGTDYTIVVVALVSILVPLATFYLLYTNRQRLGNLISRK